MNITPRRKDRTLNTTDAETVLQNAEYGFLCLKSDDEFPYGIPVNYVKNGDTIYIHCAPEGRKIDCIKRDSHAEICAVGKSITVPSNFSIDYESAIAFGEISVVDGDSEKLNALRLIVKKFSPEYAEIAETYIKNSFARTAILKFKILGISGKAKRIPNA